MKKKVVPLIHFVGFVAFFSVLFPVLDGLKGVSTSSCSTSLAITCAIYISCDPSYWSNWAWITSSLLMCFQKEVAGNEIHRPHFVQNLLGGLCEANEVSAVRVRLNQEAFVLCHLLWMCLNDLLMVNLKRRNNRNKEKLFSVSKWGAQYCF